MQTSLQSDNGTEYCNREFDHYLKANGIKRRLSTPYTSQQNGQSERKNRSLLDKARCLMIEGNIPQKLWAEAVYTANYLLNRNPAKALKGCTPHEKWVGRAPSGNHLHVFGSKAFVLDKLRKGKFTPKATEGIFVGYAQNAKGFRIYLPKKEAIIISRDVKVIDKIFYQINTNETNSYDNLFYDTKIRNQSNTDEVELQKEDLSKSRPMMDIEFASSSTPK